MTLYSLTLYNYNTTKRYDGLELKSVCEDPKTHIQHLCTYKCFGRISKHTKACVVASNPRKKIFNFSNHYVPDDPIY